MSDPRAGGSGGTGGNSSGSGGRAGNGAGGNAGKAAADGGAGPEGGRAFGGQAGALIGGASGEEAGAAGFGGGVGGEDQLGVCVLNEEPPNGKCRADGTLDFGAQLAGTQSTRLFRVDNLTSADVVFESVSVASSLFEVVSVRYVPDPEQPSQLLRVPEALPVSRAPGEALYFEVTYSAEGSAGPLPVSELRLGVESSAIRDDVVVVPMVGATLDCPVGFAACDSDPANGCETEIDSSQAHCGNCDTVCAFPHAASTCVEGECIRGTCEDGFGDCNGTTSDGCEAALASDVNNCGGCLHACAVELPGALTSCSEGSCKNEGCESGFVDLDHDPSDGCEYACTPTSGTDVPDDNFKDDNCDGIDGDASLAIFVATDGDDSNVGTAALPMATINAAILRAQASAKTQVYVSAGTYLGRVTLTNGISLYGGYSRSNGWTRSAAFVSEIRANAVANGRMSAVEGVNLTSSTTLDRFRIDTASTAQLGVSNYAMYCSSCSGLTLKNSSLEAGDAGPGAPGSNGPNGANGVSPSASGAAGSCDGSDYGVGALGGQLVCNGVSVSGGRGGDGGAEGVHAGTTGGTGSNGGGTGGPGGAGGDVGRSGTKGQSGTPVGASASGPGGSGGVISAGFWLGAAGGNGASGGHGRGGGGGGGGGGQGCTLCDDGSGNAGGGGGSGGCGGGAGFGGGAGGGAFGLFLVNSTGIVLSQNTIASGRGGQGGAGGIGGKGGSGALGVAGGQVCTDEVGKGGPGGDGSAGGQGGHGGGGAGGPAWGVYRSGTTVALVGNTIAPGIAGAGGTSLGNPGVPGAQGTAF